jgi:hypothetical protein
MKTISYLTSGHIMRPLSLLTLAFSVSVAILVFGTSSALAQSSQQLTEEEIRLIKEASDVTKAFKAKTESEKEKENVVTGIIASTVGPGQSGAVAVETTGSSPGDEQNTITGSVSNTGGRNCSVYVMNSSEKNSYRVRFAAIGENERGSRVMRKSFSATIEPKGQVTREFSCKPDLTMKLELTSAQLVSAR